MKETFASQNIAFIPYYKASRFEERAPFKLSTDAFALYWDPYMRDEVTIEEALKKVVEYIVTNEKQ